MKHSHRQSTKSSKTKKLKYYDQKRLINAEDAQYNSYCICYNLYLIVSNGTNVESVNYN